MNKKNNKKMHEHTKNAFTIRKTEKMYEKWNEKRDFPRGANSSQLLSGWQIPCQCLGQGGNCPGGKYRAGDK